MSAGLRLFLCLVLLVCTSTAAASTHFDPDLAERRLVQFGISSASAYPEAGEPLTRVELMAHFVWALGLQTSAQLLHGATTYADVPPSMWYSGHIAVVKSLGIALDTPDNLFGPDEPVNLAETLAFTMRAVRLAPLTGLAYPEDHLAAAEDVGALTTAQAQEIHGAGTQVAEGRTALAILDRLFFHAPFDGGEPLYHLYSQVAPVLSVTSPAGDLQVTVPFVVEGSASAGQAHLYPLHVSVLVDGLPVGETSLEAAGTWSVDVEVETLHGGSHDLVVEAADFAGRKAPAVRLVISVEAPTGGSGGAGGSAGEGGAGGSAGEGGAGGSAGEGGAGGSAGEGGAGGSAGEGGTGGSAGEGGAGGSAGEGGAGGSAGEGGAGGSVGEGGAGSQPAKRKSSSGGCSQGSGASIAGLFLIGLFLVRRTSRALVRAR